MDFKTYIQEAKKQEQQPEKHVAVVSGRYNPPTIGHEHLFNKAAEVAKEKGAELHVVASHSDATNVKRGTKPAIKNPLPLNKKLEYLKKVVPKGTKVYGTSPQSPTILHTLANLHKQGYTHVTLVSDGPRTEEYKKLIPKYNGVEDKHGMYNFKKIEFSSAGDRDPDAEGIEGVSATKAKQHAVAGNHEEFKRMLPAALHPHAYEIADQIRRSSLKEDYENPYRFDDGTPEGTKYMKKMTPGENKKEQPMAIKYKLKESKLPVLLMTKEQLEEKMGIKFISESTLSNLKIKSEKSNISFEIIKEIYKRGVDSHIEEASNITPHQLGMARVNSYLMKGKSFNELDSDLREQEKQDEELTLSEEDMDKIVNDLTWEDIVDLYPESDLVEDDEEELNEVLTAQGRIKKRQSFARFKGRRGVAKGIKLRRASDNATLQRRARLAARRAIYKRFLKGRDKSQMSASEKAQIEAQVARLKIIQNTLAQRLVPKIRSIEQKRIASYRTKKR